jgi:hypothetical protein
MKRLGILGAVCLAACVAFGQISNPSGGGGGGSITGVTAGTGLTGGGSSGNVTVSLVAPVTTALGGSDTTSTLTGFIRGGSPFTGGEVSGDCTTSGAFSITCLKSNGTSFAAMAFGAWPGSGIPNSTGSAWGTSYGTGNTIPNNFLGTFASGSNGLAAGAFISSTAGGDLTGTLPSPTVTQIEGAAIPASAAAAATNSSKQLIAATTTGTGSTLVLAAGPTITGTLTLGTLAATTIDGMSSFNAYAPLFAGTTSTGALQSGAAGTSGQVMGSAGGSAIGTYRDMRDVKVVPFATCPNGAGAAGVSYGSSTWTAACRAGSNNLGGALQLAPSTAGNFQFLVELPGDWDTSSQPYINIFYGSGANTSGTVIWTVSSACMGTSNLTDDPTFNAESAFATQTMAAANKAWNQNGQFTHITSGNNCVAGSAVIIKVALSGTASSAINAYQAVMTIPTLPNAAQAN